MQIKRMMVVVMGILFIATTALAIQDSADPSWLIQSELGISQIEVEVSTSRNIYNELDRPTDFITFTLSQSAYVYAFNVTPRIDDPAAGGFEQRQIQMLLPNNDAPVNFFEVGPGASVAERTFQLNQQFTFPAPPYGVGYVQLIATPIPLDLEFSPTETFTPMGNDPELFFAQLQDAIRDKDLIQPEWAGSWTQYLVEQDSPSEAGQGATCTSIVIEVRNVPAGETIDANISRNCVNGANFSRQFMSPVSDPIFQVLEGSVSVTLNGPGIPTNSVQTFTASRPGVSNENRVVFDFTPEEVEDSFGFNYAPNVPMIYQDITFTPNINTSRLIQRIDWDFGDGFQSTSQAGAPVTHAYREATTSQAPYLVRMTVFFVGGGFEFVDQTVEVKTLPPPCPSNTVTQSPLANAIRFTSTSLSGCDSLRVPNDLISLSGDVEGLTEMNFSYSWTAIPNSAVVQAFLQISYVDAETGLFDSSEDTIPLLPSDGPAGLFIQRLNSIDVPAGTNIEMTFVLNIIDNPNQGMIDFTLRTFQIGSVQNCDDAQLVLSGSRSVGFGSIIGFAQGSDIQIQLNNGRCGDLTIQPGDVEIRRDGLLVTTLGDSPVTVDNDDNATWMWDQLDEFGNQVPTGIYEIRVVTNQGTFWAKARI